jgi:uncharacterized phage protein (TIGR01671 family)
LKNRQNLNVFVTIRLKYFNMKREIKFRVRDEDSKRILGYEMFNTNHNAGFTFIYTDDKEQILHSEFSMPPMIKPLSSFGRLFREQFTGLLDKNGKEIYEGDIVTIYDPYIKSQHTDQIIWDDNNCRFAIKNTYIDFDFLIVDEVEIAGNIYENSDLI